MRWLQGHDAATKLCTPTHTCKSSCGGRCSIGTQFITRESEAYGAEDGDLWSLGPSMAGAHPEPRRVDSIRTPRGSASYISEGTDVNQTSPPPYHQLAQKIKTAPPSKNSKSISGKGHLSDLPGGYTVVPRRSTIIPRCTGTRTPTT